MPAATFLPEGDPGRPEGSDSSTCCACQYSLGPSNYVGALVVDAEFRRRIQPRRRRRPVVARDTDAAHQRLSCWDPRRAHRTPAIRKRRASARRPATSTTRGKLVAHRLRRALRSGLPDGHGVHQPRRHHERVGLRRNTASIPDKTKYPWLLRVSPFSFTQGGRDRNAGGNDLLQVSGVRLQFTRQGFFRFDRFDGYEPWAGQQFDRGSWRMQGASAALSLAVARRAAPMSARRSSTIRSIRSRGDRTTRSVGMTLQPSGRLSQALTYAASRSIASRPASASTTSTSSTAGRRISSRGQFFVRGIAQYDSSRSRVLTDFLSSYELRPGTVVYAGYGSLIERRDFVDNEWVTGVGKYETSHRGLFFKASYLYRF